LTELSPGQARCLLFDWDGTVVDSQLANYNAMAQALGKNGVELEQAWFDARTGLSSAEMIRTLIAERGLDLPVSVQEVVELRQAIFMNAAKDVRTHPEVAEVVVQYRGRLPMAVASGGSRAVITATLQCLHIKNHFDAIVTREDVDRGKPAPDIFLKAADLLRQAPSHCLVYEDSDEGIEAAHAAGMRVIDVRPYLRGRLARLQEAKRENF
jgi:HAD superfamily hydrolase (TIGR01509 family)